MKTANTPKHNYSKAFKRYIKSKSTRSIEAIHQTKRLDAGFFWLDFYPLVRDIFMAKYKQYNEKEYEALLQLHASQPFSVDDVYSCIVRKTSWDDDWSIKTFLGVRTTKSFMDRAIQQNHMVLFKNNGRYNKKLYTLSTEMNNELRRMYEQMLCLSKIRLDNPNHVPPIMKQSKVHVRKILKQNNYKEAFDADLDRKLQTSNDQFGLTLRKIRATSRML